MGMEEVSERAKDGAVRNAAATGGALMGAAFFVLAVRWEEEGGEDDV